MFWEATPLEFYAAVDGHNDAHRIGPKPMTRERYEELKKDYG